MPKYSHKVQALQSAVKVWVCKSCGLRHDNVKPKACNCGFNEFYYFASRFEAKRFSELNMLLKEGLISELTTQASYSLDVNGAHICRYISDFRYTDTGTGNVIVEDTKGDKRAVTDVFKLKSKLMRAIHGIEIKMVYQSDRKRGHRR